MARDVEHELGDGFFNRVDQLRKFYQALVSDDTDDEILDWATEEVQAVNYGLEGFVESEKIHGVNRDERREFLYVHMQDLVEMYTQAGRAGDLDFTDADVDDYIDPDFKSSGDED